MVFTVINEGEHLWKICIQRCLIYKETLNILDGRRNGVVLVVDFVLIHTVVLVVLLELVIVTAWSFMVFIGKPLKLQKNASFHYRSTYKLCYCVSMNHQSNPYTNYS